MRRGGLIERSYLITAEEAALLERAGLHELRMRIRGNNEQVDRILLDLRKLAASTTSFADNFRPSETAKAATGSEQWITPTQAAHQLGVTPTAIRQAAKENRIQGECIEGRWRIRQTDIDIWKTARAAKERRK